MARRISQIYTQSTFELCWEACGRMLWHWKYGSLKGYQEKAGKYLGLKRGLSERECDTFYVQLGLRSFAHPHGSNLRHALAWSPVILALVDGSPTGHAIVIDTSDGAKYDILNPCLQASINFDTDDSGAGSCVGGRVSVPGASVDKSIGAYMWYW
jgi:hypothetical protein